MIKVLIHEPMTVFTDLIIFLLAGYFAKEIHTLFTVHLMNTHWHWTFAFWMIGIGAFLGAVSHGFSPHFTKMVKTIIWKLTVLSIGISCYFFLKASFFHIFSNATVQWLQWIPLIILIVYSTIIVKDHRFTIVILFYLPTMIFVLAMMIYSQFILEFNGSGLISIGILISFLAAGIQLSGFSLHKHFNHNDIYHIVQMVGMYSIYKGVLQIKDFGLY